LSHDKKFYRKVCKDKIVKFAKYLLLKINPSADFVCVHKIFLLILGDIVAKFSYLCEVFNSLIYNFSI
jgi:hypothetical protein